MNELVLQLLRKFQLTEAQIQALSTGSSLTAVDEIYDSTKQKFSEIAYSNTAKIQELKKSGSGEAFKEVVRALKKNFDLTPEELKKDGEDLFAVDLIAYAKDKLEKQTKEKYQNMNDSKLAQEYEQMSKANKNLQDTIEHLRNVEMPAAELKYREHYETERLNLKLESVIANYKVVGSHRPAYLAVTDELRNQGLKLTLDKNDLAIVNREGVKQFVEDKELTLDKFITDTLTRYELMAKSNANNNPTQYQQAPAQAPVNGNGMLVTTGGQKPSNMLGMDAMARKMQEYRK